MRAIRRLAWAATIAIPTGSPAYAQQTSAGGNIGTASSQTATSSGTTTTTSAGGNQSTQGGNQSSQGTGQNNFQLNTMDAAPVLTKPSKSQIGNTNTGINASNVF